jgi:hypothetical protein
MSIISNVIEIRISKILFTIRHHAVMDTVESSIIGIPSIQFSRTEFKGVYCDIFGYINGIPYILARLNMFHISE